MIESFIEPGSVEFPEGATPPPPMARGLFDPPETKRDWGFPRQFLSRLLKLRPEERRKRLLRLPAEDQQILGAMLQFDWGVWARPKQLPPPGDWRFWILLAGRGFGKTRTGAEWIRAKAESGEHKWLTIVGPTREAVYKVMLKGPAGLLNISPPWFMPKHIPSRTLLLYPNGVMVRYYSAERPERLRGEQHEVVWCDEVAAWPRQESFEQIDLGLRLGPRPQMLVTTTPRPLPLIVDMVLGPRNSQGVRVPRADVVVTAGKSEENRFNLAKGALESMRARYGDSRLGRQELDAELLERTGSELWTEERIGALRVAGVPRIRTYVVGVDPTRADEPHDECGIIVAGLGEDGHAYILEDDTVRATPYGWASAAVAAFHKFRADRIVYEKSGFSRAIEDLLQSVSKQSGAKVVWRPVWAKEGQSKQVRAEPVSALYEQGKVHHVGPFPLLEDEMCNWDPENDVSPNRMDALVWAVTDLLLGEQRAPLIVR